MNKQVVQEYYGDILKSTSDLRTDACTTNAAPPPSCAHGARPGA